MLPARLHKELLSVRNEVIHAGVTPDWITVVQGTATRDCRCVDLDPLKASAVTTGARTPGREAEILSGSD